MREDEQVAEAMGISVVRYKLLAFAMGGALGGMAGALFAVKTRIAHVASFTVLVSITALAVVILGGLGSHPRRDPRRVRVDRTCRSCSPSSRTTACRSTAPP